MDPKVKRNLLVEEVQDEILVYDLDEHRAHCLNATAGFLLRSADGTRSVDALVAMAGDEFGEAVDADVVALGLDRLRRAGLVEWSDPAAPGAQSRREMLKKLAVVGLLLPTVMTLMSPTPAQALTYISTKDCGLATVGACCTNAKLCVQGRNGKFACSDPGC